MKLNAANRLTVARLALIPPFLVLLLSSSFYARIGALLVFVAASLTDLYDGRIARRRNLVTTLGTFLDPLADKLLISTAFIAFIEVEEFHVPAWMVVLIIGREFLITGLRSLAAAQGRILPAQPAGKFKTTSQIVVIIATLLIMIVHSGLSKWGRIPAIGDGGGTGALAWVIMSGPYWLMFAITILTIASGYVYIKNNLDLFDGDSRPPAR